MQEEGDNQPAEFDLVIGCPVANRGWIVERWIDHVASALVVAGVENCRAAICLAGGVVTDPTFPIARRRAAEYAMALLEVDTGEPASQDVRRWNRTRYVHMAAVRNALLSEVRVQRPTAFWSVDSDVLAAPPSLRNGLEALATADAVGGCCYMTPTGTAFPSHGLLTRRGDLHRPNENTLVRTDVVMASVLMGRTAYEVNYEPHPLGEDVGWSIAAGRRGCSLAWDGSVVSKHVMSRAQLDAIDERCGF
jgi:hypothetical protein